MKNGKLKKLITLATVVASTFALVACGSSSSDDSKGSDSSAKKDSETVYRTLDEIKKTEQSISEYFPIRIHLDMLMKTVNIRDMMYTSRTESVKISV